MDTKFCKDCKWAKRSLEDIIFGFGFQFAKCAVSPKLPSLVDGTTELNSCHISRHYGPCGPRGTLFEAR